MEDIILVIYVILGYWATGQTIFANKIVIHQFGQLFLFRLVLGVLLGFLLIPIALLKMVFTRR